ncbi:hypothetical protein PoB_002199500 [Plakobranchus ocellatus]|uniref:Secreted protein n=1 Tax=Plakobranchus ocellatus TaxID=259542 RepID=A0AAV3ZK18_9GAST|nr:hypothetical protein PoB_002199500 [Plakobranchus ocellatus]
MVELVVVVVVLLLLVLVLMLMGVIEALLVVFYTLAMREAEVTIERSYCSPVVCTGSWSSCNTGGVISPHQTSPSHTRTNTCLG